MTTTTVPSAAHAYEAQRSFIGVVTPSGNTVVERITLGILADLPTVSAHFSRTPVFGAKDLLPAPAEVDAFTKDPSPDSYAVDGLLAAARLLAHVQPQVLLWNGSKGAAIGFEHDRALAGAFTRETGIPATTSVLGLEAALAARGIRRIALLTPYTEAGQQEAIDCLTREGYEVVAEQHLSMSGNLSYAGTPLPRIAEVARAAVRGAASRPQAIVSLCTNFPAATMAAPLEAELGLPMFDTTALGVWHALQMCGVDTTAAALRWGSLFAPGA